MRHWRATSEPADRIRDCDGLFRRRMSRGKRFHDGGGPTRIESAAETRPSGLIRSRCFLPKLSATTPQPGLRPAAVALRAAQNSGLPCSSDRRAPDPSRQSADGCALWSRLEKRYLRLPSPLRHNIFRQTRAPFGPHSDEDLRWRPGAPQACHFASVITNKLSEVDPSTGGQVATRPMPDPGARAAGRKSR